MLGSVERLLLPQVVIRLVRVADVGLLLDTSRDTNADTTTARANSGNEANAHTDCYARTPARPS